MSDEPNIDEEQRRAVAAIIKQNARDERIVRALSWPLGPRLARWMVRAWWLIAVFFMRTWNRFHHPGRFIYTCHYCGRSTAQAPHAIEEGKTWPSCCSRRKCLRKWDSL